eukprot:Clim_evm78s147 gene=Clim_evmTU78s147
MFSMRVSPFLVDKYKTVLSYLQDHIVPQDSNNQISDLLRDLENEGYLGSTTETIDASPTKESSFIYSSAPWGSNKLSHLVGLDEAKRTLKQALILPRLVPQAFRGIKTWRRILLYGPPGCGKTALARAIAVEANVALYFVSASTLLGPYHGQSEQRLRGIFHQAAQEGNEGIIFIDEIDSIGTRRSTDEQAHDRRLKTELLLCMDSLDSMEHVFLIAATNCASDLDQALLRRFEQQIYVGLPTVQAIMGILEKQASLTDVRHLFNDEHTLRQMAKSMQKRCLSGADVNIVFRMAFLRRLNDITEDVYNMESPGREYRGHGLNMEDDNDTGRSIYIRPVNWDDFQYALDKFSETRVKQPPLGEV